jgi:hypothetical protein
MERERMELIARRDNERRNEFLSIAQISDRKRLYGRMTNKN